MRTLATGGCLILSTERRKALSSASGIVEYELEATPISLRLDEREISTWGYNEGQTLRAMVINHLP